MTEYQDNSKKFEILRQQYPVFTYESFSYSFTDNNDIKSEFCFTCNDITFRPTHVIEHNECFNLQLSSEQLRLLVFNIGMIELVSYWKAFCSPTVVIKAANLTDGQISFWKKIYFNGLGEFFYLNNITTDINEFMTVECQSTVCLHKQNFQLEDNYLVPVGGGKDSVVSLELLRGAGKDVLPMVINPNKATQGCIIQTGYKQQVRVLRTIDANLIKLNGEGFLNGHTPFSAMLAFTTLLTAALSGRKYIALSNELSANEATDIDSGVNHQYSKSLEFENDFRAYCQEYISDSFCYFSLLRPFCELEIARMFSWCNCFEVFRSCNVGSKQDIWCGNCPKCLFAFIILSPFAPQDKLLNVFSGKNLYSDPNLMTYFKQLTGLEKVKPFECVGTVEEVNAAIALRIKNFGVKDDEILLKYWLSTDLSRKYSDTNSQKLLGSSKHPYNIPEDLQHVLKNPYCYIKKAEISRTLQDESIAVMGLGREGVATLKLIKELHGKKSCVVFEQNRDTAEKYKDLLSGCRVFTEKKDLPTIDSLCSMIFLSPAMAKKDFTQLNETKLTNQCDLFLNVFAPQTIGISGTKGKSTVSSLTYTVLKQQLPDTVLAGNIGIPVLDILESITCQSKIVLELSCHQLQLIHRSPHVSVLLNLYEEHLDHYYSFEDYQLAKVNLLTKGCENDIFIYNADDERINHWVKYFGLTRRYVPLHIDEYNIDDSKYLLGNHNRLNIMASLACAKTADIDYNQAVADALEFKSLPHRIEFIGKHNGVGYYDDSISTVPQATIAALHAVDNVSVLILGGMDRGIDYSPLKEELKKNKGLCIAFTGLAGKRMAEEFDIKHSDNKFIITDDWNEIMDFCRQNAEENTNVLLSPAASSYDKFKNFEHRGDFFKQLALS
ncbi:MAG: UDP-N-acetylmuramoyl-L-alanine--D-glutamate ligase [Bacteroidales bacterium]|nr:UDP-N-acetylmuramoyl-L-alanine--D-glutamate ligase [Bacteroidales bacterium]